jgi:hypothetical protein
MTQGTHGNHVKSGHRFHVFTRASKKDAPDVFYGGADDLGGALALIRQALDGWHNYAFQRQMRPYDDEPAAVVHGTTPKTID